MALNKTVKVDKIEIVGDYKHVQVRTATVIDEDGTEWFEDEDGYWWYRLEGDEDWQPYEE